MDAAWHPDPGGRHELRYWDGASWTDHVSDHGNVSSDPLPPAPQQGGQGAGQQTGQQGFGGGQQSAQQTGQQSSYDAYAGQHAAAPGHDAPTVGPGSWGSSAPAEAASASAAPAGSSAAPDWARELLADGETVVATAGDDLVLLATDRRLLVRESSGQRTVASRTRVDHATLAESDGDGPTHRVEVVLAGGATFAALADEATAAALVRALTA